MFKINQFSYTTKDFKVNPKEKILFGMMILLLCLGLNSIGVSITVVIIMGVITIRNSNVSLYEYIKFLYIPLGFLFLGTIMIIIVKENIGNGKILFGMEIWGYGITKKSLLQGVSLILKSLGSISCMYFIIITTSMCDILNGLRELKIPKLLVSLMELMYRYIFIILEEANRMNIARRARLGDVSFYKNIKSLGELSGTLFLKTFFKGNKIYSALESRGYDGELKILNEKYEKGRFYTKGFMITCILITIKIFELKIK